LALQLLKGVKVEDLEVFKFSAHQVAGEERKIKLAETPKAKTAI